MPLYEHMPRRVKMVVQALPPILAVAAIALVITFSVNANQAAARRACNAVHQSNVALVHYLGGFVKSGPRADESQGFLDGLSAAYEKVYQDCLNGVT